MAADAVPHISNDLLRHSINAHTGAVLSLVFTKNGRYALSGSQDNTVKLWNPQSGLNVKTYKGSHNYEVNSVIVFEDNGRFASAGADKQFFVSDVTTGQAIRHFRGHERKVNALALGPKESVLISASHDKTARIWDLRSSNKGSIQVLDEAKDSLLCVLAEGDEIVTGSVDGVLRRYDLRKGQLCADIVGQPIGSVSFSNDSQCVLVSTLKDTIHLIERETGNELACYKGHTNQQYKVQSVLDPTDACVVSGSEDHRICFWELVEAEMVSSVKAHVAPVLCCRFSGGTLMTGSADGVIKVWNIQEE